jgi:hypothetical protein
MPIVKYENTLANKAIVEALPDPKYIMYGARIAVFTGADIPPADAVTNPSSIVLNLNQLHAGALAIGQIRLTELETYITGILTTGTSAQKIFWRYSGTIRRTGAKVNQMRLATGWSNALLDSIFVAGSGLDP